MVKEPHNERLKSMSPQQRVEWERASRGGESAWDRMSGPTRAIVVIWMILYFGVLPVWTLLNAP